MRWIFASGWIWRAAIRRKEDRALVHVQILFIATIDGDDGNAKKKSMPK
jgi:hypothetical protein